MIMPVTEEQLESCNGGIRKLTELMQQHPNLPVIPMVDSEVIQSDEYGSWSASFGGDPYISKICVNNETERLVFWDDKTDLCQTFEECGFDYDECGISDVTDEEAKRVMEKKISELNWLLCIIAPIGVPEPFIPSSKSPEPEGTFFERLQERVRKYAAQTH